MAMRANPSELQKLFQHFNDNEHYEYLIKEYQGPLDAK